MLFPSMTEPEGKLGVDKAASPGILLALPVFWRLGSQVQTLNLSCLGTADFISK